MFNIYITARYERRKEAFKSWIWRLSILALLSAAVGIWWWFSYNEYAQYLFWPLIGHLTGLLGSFLSGLNNDLNNLPILCTGCLTVAAAAGACLWEGETRSNFIKAATMLGSATIGGAFRCGLQPLDGK